MTELQGKVALITGASSGIGAAIAIKLANNGVQVVALARRMEKLLELQKEVTSDTGKIHAVKADVTVEEDVLNAFKWAEDNLEKVDFLINNAGMVVVGSTFDGNVEDWMRTTNTNFISSCITVREFYKLYKKNNSNDCGHIINISSMSWKLANVPHVYLSNLYPATKAAMTTFSNLIRTDIISKEANIKVTTIHPGAVTTEMYAPTHKKALKPEDIADTIAFVLSTPPTVTITELNIQPTDEIYL